MAKRWTDSDKWNDEWYVSLPNDYRIVWQWLLDNCNHAGVCKRSLTILNDRCRTDLTEEFLLHIMGGRLLIVDSNWFIPKFLRFQYKTLKSKKPAIISVVTILLSGNYWKYIPESFGNNYIIIESLPNDPIINKDTDKDKDIVLGDYVGGVGEEKGGVVLNGQSKNQEEMIVREMDKVWKSKMPGYPSMLEVDYPSYLKIAYLIAERKGWKHPAVIDEKEHDVLRSWTKIVDFLCGPLADKFLKGLTVDGLSNPKNFQKIEQCMFVNLKSVTNGSGYNMATDLEQKRKEFLEKQVQRNGQ